MSRNDPADGGAPAVQLMDNTDSPGLENEFFFCSWEWHIARLSSVCALIYPFAFKVSGGIESKLFDRRFFASAVSLATYFGYSECQVRRGLKELENAGFFQLIARKKFKPTHYRVLSHDEWAAKHKRRCTTKVQFPWTGEGDPLGRSLWKMTCGEVRFGDFQMRGLRNLGVDQNKILEEFSVYWEQTGQRMKPQNVPRGFYMHIRNSSSQAAQKRYH